MYHRIGKSGARYWGRSGAGIFFTDGQRVLLLKRSEKGDHGGMWGIPGGKVEESESAIDAALRESREECGKVEGRRFDSLEERDGHHHWMTYFYRVDKPFKCKLSDEHTAWKWIPFNELKSVKLHPQFERNMDRYRRLLERKGGTTFREWL